jgi:hypothetical protein
MSNLSSYRLSIVVFSLGLLWAVSEMVGDGERPGLLDHATKSLVHRLDAKDEGNGESSETVARSESQPLAESRQSSPRPPLVARAEAQETASSSSSIETGAADETTSSQGEEGVGTTEGALPPPDVGLIHK